MRIALPLLFLLAASPAMARVGGGESWGGGGGGGGGSGGGGELVGFVLEILIRLFLWNPSVGLAVVIVVVAGGWWLQRQEPNARFVTAAPPPEAARSARDSVQKTLAAMDPRFSAALFVDFAQLLYVRFQNARASGDLDPLAPYMAQALLERATEDAKSRGLQRVDDVLVGATRITGLTQDDTTVRLDVAFEANFTEIFPTGTPGPLYTAEAWTFARKKGVLSKGPEDITALNCPSCGSPSEMRPDGTCPYCDKVVNQGDFQWRVEAIRILHQAPRPPVDLLAGGEERGTGFPTVYPPNFEAARRAFTARNPDFSWEAFEARVREIFLALQEAWSSLQWAKARPCETDALFNMHRYWMDMYARQGLRNRLEDIAITQVAPVRFDQDAFFDLVTVRIWATMKDYVTDADGNVKGGNPGNTRAFSEYWTFMRRTGARRKAEGTGCPNCGAPLEVNMAGECAWCGSRVVSGQFDWVLSAIEQDDAYVG